MTRPALPRDTELALRLSGAIWGHLVGDAVGVPYEFKPADPIGDVRFGASGTHGQTPGADSYARTIERAVAYGKDTDTTAAIAGGLAGIWWGLPGIPADWLAGMRGRDVAQPLIDRLLEKDGALAEVGIGAHRGQPG